MKKHLKKAFIPHEENEYRPHILRGTGVGVLVIIALLSFGFSIFHATVLIKNSDLIAAIFPAVLTDLTNESRAEEASLGGLRMNPTLQVAAQLKANHMAENSYFAHTSPDGVTPWHWFIEAGYQFTHAGENLAVNFVDSEDVVEAWLQSPGHRANILNNDFTEIGIATAEGTYKGHDTVFVVQLFGRPATVAAAETTPEVASEEITSEDIEENLEVVEEDDLFVAVQNTVVAEEINESSTEEPAQVEPAEAIGLQADQSTLFERLASQPREVLQWIYTLLAAIILLALTFYTLIEIEKHHPKHVVYGILLLVLLILLIYANRMFVFPGLEII